MLRIVLIVSILLMTFVGSVVADSTKQGGGLG